MSSEISDYEFQQALAGYHRRFQPFQAYETDWILGNADGSVIDDPNDPSQIIVSRPNEERRIKRGNIAPMTPAGTPIAVGAVVGYGLVNSAEAKGIFPPAISNYNGESFQIAYVGDATAIGYADSKGNLKGIATQFAFFESSSSVVASSTGTTAPSYTLETISAAGIPGIRFLTAENDGSGNKQAVTAGRIIGRFSSRAYGTSSYPNVADSPRFEMRAAQNQTNTARGTEFDFYTVPNNTAVGVLGMTLAEDGLLEAKFGVTIKRVNSTNSITVPDTYCIVLAEYYSLAGSASLSLAGDAVLKII